MDILTLTVNPAIDKSVKVDGLIPEKKLRCIEPVYDAGGGGVNVARAIKKLGGDSLAVYLAGGPSGQMMEELLDHEGVTQKMMPIKGRTRENFIAYDIRTQQQYRFGMPGPAVQNNEWEQCLAYIKQLEQAPGYLVASGSLAPDIPADFYARLAKIAGDRNIKLVLDTSGDALKRTLEEGVYMFKPNLSELMSLTGNDHINDQQIIKAGQELIDAGKCTLILVSLGARGALLITAGGHEHVTPPTVHPKSTVGAGDSMVAGMVYALSQQQEPVKALRYGVAAGTAATMNAGTALCNKEDVDWILELME